MTTKSEVRQLARQALGLGASVSTRRRFTTWWLVEVSDSNDRLALSEEAPTLRAAYAAIAARLRSFGAFPATEEP